MFKKIIFFVLFFLILVVNLYSLKPILNSGFYFDDAYNSQTKSYLNYQNKTVAQFNKEISNGWLQHGRILPGFIYGGYGFWVNAVTSLLQYKVFMIFMHLTVIIIFSLLLYRLSKMPSVFFLSFLIIPIFMQFRRSPDPVTSFAFLVPLNLLYLETSLIFLKEYLVKNKKIFMILSIFFYLLMLLMFYEISYIFFPMVIYIIYLHKKRLWPTLKLSLPYIFFSLIFIGIYFYVLIHATTGTYNGSTINFNIWLIISAFLKQVSASLPLSYFFVSKPQLFHINPFDYFYATVTSLITVHLLTNSKLKKQTIFVFFPLGFLLVILSTIPIALSKRYQLEVGWGIGYLPVYIAYFGSALILIASLLLIRKKITSSFLKGAFIIVSSIFIGIAAFFNLQNNKLVVEDLNYIFKHPRDLVTASLSSKIVDNIDENSTLITLNDLYWDNSNFYSDIAKKRFNVLNLDSFINKLNDVKDLKIIKSLDNTYLINYRVINKKLGFVYIAKIIDMYFINNDEKIFLTKNVQLFIKNNSPYEFVDYRSFSNIFYDGFKKNRVKLSELKLIQKNEYGEVYQINFDELISFDSIKLINPNNSDELNNPNNISTIENSYLNGLFYIWKQGVSGLETNANDNWRWAINKSKLLIINSYPYERVIKMSMTISTGYSETSNLNIRNPVSGIDENIKISINPTNYEMIVYLHSGVNEFNLVSDSKRIINAGDPRDLRFKISNFSAMEIR